MNVEKKDSANDALHDIAQHLAAVPRGGDFFLPCAVISTSSRVTECSSCIFSSSSSASIAAEAKPHI